MTYCPSVCRYRVTFSDGTIMYSELPGDINERERVVGNRTGH